MEPKGTIASSCTVSAVRTGNPNCDRSEGKTTGLIITPLNALYPLDGKTFTAGMEGYLTDDALRMMPIKNIASVTHNGGDINAPELGTYGGACPIGVNAVNDVFQIDGGDCLYKELSKLNKRRVRIFRCDDEGYLFGTVVTKDGKDYFAGFEATVYVTDIRTDGSTLNNLSITAYYSLQNEREEINKASVFLENGLPAGLVGVMLEVVGNKVRVVTSCDRSDVTAFFIDDWDATMFLNESGTAATTVTADKANNLLTIAPAGKYCVAPAKVLAVGNITGLDGVKTYVQITAGS